MMVVGIEWCLTSRGQAEFHLRIVQVEDFPERARKHLDHRLSVNFGYRQSVDPADRALQKDPFMLQMLIESQKRNNRSFLFICEDTNNTMVLFHLRQQPCNLSGAVYPIP